MTEPDRATPIETQSDPPPVLEYRRPEPEPHRFRSMHVVIPFAAGVALPLLVVLALHDAYEEDYWLAFLVTWGLSAALLIAIKIRGAFRALQPRGGPWWVHALGGVINLIAFYVIITQTTAREHYARSLGENCTRLLGIILSLAVAYAVATVLTPPRKRI